jgi:hypothetical protein
MEGKKREERKSQGKNKILTGLPAQSAFRFQQNPNQKKYRNERGTTSHCYN